MKMFETGFDESEGCDWSAGRVVLAGAGLGVAGDLLLWDINWLGPGFAVWVALLGATAVGVNRKAPRVWRMQLMLWSFVAVVAAWVLVLRAAMAFIPLVALTLLACALVVVMQAKGVGLGEARVGDQIRALLQLPVRVAMGGWLYLARVNLKAASLDSRWKGILRGALLSVPLLVIFVALFSSVDATFERYASRFGDLLAQDFPRHILIMMGLGWVSIGLLACTVPQDDVHRPEVSVRRVLGLEETAVMLGSLVTLFLIFVVVQLGYLFGGREVIEQTSGLTLAQYARRGFFELMIIAMLAMVILHGIAVHQAGSRLFKVLALTLVALVMCVLMSAAQRLVLYIDEFGLTLSRLLATACMIWVGLCLLMFSVALAREREAGLASGYLLSGMAILLALVAVNPAARVASVNLQQAMEKSVPLDTDYRLDVNYLLQLGPDVVPLILENLENLPLPDQCTFARGLHGRYGTGELVDSDWRSWNASRSAAIRAVGEDERLSRLTCGVIVPTGAGGF